jgi:hypothetical protein
VNETELKRKRFALIAKIAIGAGILIVAAPLIMILAKSIIAVGVIGAVALVGVNAAPILAFKLANWRIKEIIQEAKTNPIETMIGVAVDRANKLVEAKTRIGNLSASTKNFADKVAGFKKQWPNEAAVFDQGLANANQVLEQWKQQYKIASAALEDYKLEIDKCNAVNDMAKELAALNNMAQMDGDKLMEELKSKTAIDEVSRRMNSAMAQLETSLLTEVKFDVPGASQQAMLLSNNPAQVVDFSPVKVAQKV